MSEGTLWIRKCLLGHWRQVSHGWVLGLTDVEESEKPPVVSTLCRFPVLENDQSRIILSDIDEIPLPVWMSWLILYFLTYYLIRIYRISSCWTTFFFKFYLKLPPGWHINRKSLVFLINAFTVLVDIWTTINSPRFFRHFRSLYSMYSTFLRHKRNQGRLKFFLRRSLTSIRRLFSTKLKACTRPREECRSGLSSRTCRESVSVAWSFTSTPCTVPYRRLSQLLADCVESPHK